ncbi:MAG TPA: DUF3124 domain-containing protein [Planctomycetaceae bacterium]|nr:DUF3124 domain-containing protein [Planctomycetaceae bacterium]
MTEGCIDVESIDQTPDRLDGIAGLACSAHSAALLGCGLLVAIGAFGVLLTGYNQSIQAPSQRDDHRREINMLPWHPVQGQRLYVPAYSHVYHQKGDPYFLTVTLNIRNTDVKNEIVVTSVRYFDTSGKELKSLLQSPLRLSPLAATEFVIARDDKAGGSGASFLVEWSAGTKVTPPLVETVNIDTTLAQGLSFISPAFVLDETEPFDSVP